MGVLRAFGVDFRIRSARLEPNVFLVSVSGELDVETSPQLAGALAALDGRCARRLVVDLSDVTLLDSVALGALVAEARLRNAQENDLVLVCDDPRTLRTLHVTGLLPLFEVHASLRDALDPRAPS
jgi:anti-sigma B factor antagonist